ncbi:MAG: putative signal transducing protein [Bacteroidota bacterium]
MNENWEKVYTSAIEHRVEIVKAVLKDNEIDAVSINKKDRSYLFGEIELYVHADHVIKAMSIINKENL